MRETETLTALLRTRIQPLHDQAREGARQKTDTTEGRLARASATGELMAYSRILSMLPFLELEASERVSDHG